MASMSRAQRVRSLNIAPADAEAEARLVLMPGGNNARSCTAPTEFVHRRRCAWVTLTTVKLRSTLCRLNILAAAPYASRLEDTPPSAIAAATCRESVRTGAMRKKNSGSGKRFWCFGDSFKDHLTAEI